ncbi:MAG: sugar phosphate isomerase/epimerase family protein [Chthonomonadales bacterium]
MKFGICNETFQGWEWKHICEYASDVGYDGVEIAPFTLCDDIRRLSAQDVVTVRTAAEKANVEIIGLHWLLVSPKGLSITTANPDMRANTSDFLSALTRLCRDLGGKVMVLGSPAQRRLEEADSSFIAEDRLIEALRPAIEIAEESGITICLEPLPAPEANFLLTLQEAVSLANRIASHAVKTIFDVKSACSENRPLPDLILENRDFIAHVHANDANRRGPGFGDTDFKTVLGPLQAIDYNEYVSVEVFDYTPDPETIATKSLETLRACL